MNPTENIQSTADITTCDREPIHIPGAIQPHGFLVALDPANWAVRYISENARNFLLISPGDALGRPVEDLFTAEIVALLRQTAANPLFIQRALFVASVRSAGEGKTPYTLLAHQYGPCIILEGEMTEEESDLTPRLSMHHEMEVLLAGMENAREVGPLLQLAAEETRRITGFDRVMIYQFDSDWNGQVMAEDRNSRLPSYLDLRFPASDIPRQARELYRVNRLRLIARNDYEPVRLLGLAQNTEQLDLTLSTLRSVSPVHLEYMRNMGMSSSMSISLMRGGELWGLISCHSADPKVVPFEIRGTCELIGQVLSLQILMREQGADSAYRNELNKVLTRLMTGMSQLKDVVAGLRGQSVDLLGLANASGAAVLFQDKLELIGRTPAKEDVLELVKWLHQHTFAEVIAFDRLAEVYPPAARYREVASGVLAIALSRVHRNYVLWFRPEVIATVKWGGNPAKRVEQPVNEPSRLHPRKSFDAWAEIVRGKSIPWKGSELDVVRELRTGIMEVILQYTEQLASMSAELVKVNKDLESISYTISHDLRAPLRAMYGYADSLVEDAAQKLDPDELDRLNRISQSAHQLDGMIRDVLRYGHVSRMEYELEPISLDEVVRRVIEQNSALQEASITIHGSLPKVMGNAEMLEHALSALLNNAVKFVEPGIKPVVNVRAEAGNAKVRLWIEDNGIGIPPEHHLRIFDVFHHVHPTSKFEGNGVGLAIAKRAVKRLRGNIGVESIPGHGSHFWIQLLEA